jgi:hypothetical protein
MSVFLDAHLAFHTALIERSKRFDVVEGRTVVPVNDVGSETKRADNRRM